MRRPRRLVRGLPSLMLCLGAAACHDNNTASPGGPRAEDARPATAPIEKTAFAKTWNRRIFDHGLWDRVLRAHVDEAGNVDYAGIARSEAFREYLWRLSRTDAAGLANDRERLAFWINAYNALTIRAVLDTLPQDRDRWAEYSVQDVRVGGKSLWKGPVFDVGGGRRTLDAIEHDILRRQDGLRDPRIHVALVCAARGCPPLWNRAYTGAAIQEQLAAAMRRFVNNERQCAIDPARGLIRISRVFDWYRDDFSSPAFSPRAESVPAFLAMSVDDPALAAALQSRAWRFEYVEYDWKLNLRR